MPNQLIEALAKHLMKVISETNGISLEDTLELASYNLDEKPSIKKSLLEFRKLLASYNQDEVEIGTLLIHPVAQALKKFFKNFPLTYREEHIHLTGSLSSEFVLPRLKKLLQGPHGEIYWNKIKSVYPHVTKIETLEDVDELMRLKDDEHFDRYLEILLLPKLILINRKTHEEASYHMAKELYEKHNVGMIRLKFSLSRASSNEKDQIPGLEEVTEEDVVMGLYEGFKKFQKEVPQFNFVLSPSFRKEADFYDAQTFESKRDHFHHQILTILKIIDEHPELNRHLCDVDTVGNERDLYRKSHFMDMKLGFRRLHYRGFSIRSHHGETWHTLKKGVQAVDNAMNIWHINTLEHGLSLGINPNYYFHSLYLRVLDKNTKQEPIERGSGEFKELMEMDWGDDQPVLNKLLKGEPLNSSEKTLFTKIKFHTAREVEHYQHDVLNRMINKKVSLIALPSSNKKPTGKGN